MCGHTQRDRIADRAVGAEHGGCDKCFGGGTRPLHRWDGPRLCILVSHAGPLPNKLKGFKDFYLKAKPESGLDCLMCAEFARQRPSATPSCAVQGACVGRAKSLCVKEWAMPRALDLQPPRTPEHLPTFTITPKEKSSQTGSCLRVVTLHPWRGVVVNSCRYVPRDTPR